MVRPDIVASLKNAIERGYPLEQAKQTLINSGYSPQEVQEASNYLNSGIQSISQPQQQNTTQNPNYPQQSPNQNYQNQPQEQQNQLNISQKKKFPWAIVILVIILILLITVLGLSFLFKDNIISFFRNL